MRAKWRRERGGVEAGEHTDSRLVIIDAGHGGDDPGKIGVDGVQEKDLNLKMALALRDLLEQQDVEVLMTREVRAVSTTSVHPIKRCRICGGAAS